MRRIVSSLFLAAALAACNMGSTPSPEAAGDGSGTGTDAGNTPGSPVPDPHSQEPTTTPGTGRGGIKPSPGCFAASTPRRLTRTQFVNALADASRSAAGRRRERRRQGAGAS